MKIVLLLIFWSLAFVSNPSYGATSEPMAIKSAFVFKFTSFIEFPNESHAYKVGFLGSQKSFSLFSHAFETNDKSGSTFDLIYIEKKSDLSSLDILYVESSHFPSDVSKVKALIISEEMNGLEKGAAINFLLIDDSIRFEIDMIKSQKMGFKINSRLLNLAKRVIH